MYQLERAIFDLRRGVPVLITGADGDRLVRPLEGHHEGELATLFERGAQPRLVVTQHRLAAAGYQAPSDIVTLLLSAQALPETLAEGEVPPHEAMLPATSAERVALGMLRRGQLMPAALMVTPAAEDEVQPMVAAGTLLALDAGEAELALANLGRAVTRISEARVPLADAEVTRFILFREADGMREHLAVIIGDPHAWPAAVPIRLHSACLTGDLFASLLCDCGEQLRNAVRDIHALGGGVLLYLDQEGRDIGMANKLRAIGLQEAGLDTLDADACLGFGHDERCYAPAVAMLENLDIQRVQLLTNNPRKLAALTEAGIEVAKRQAVYGRVTEQNRAYLTTKAGRSGHWLESILDQDDSA
ncbi:GTP cyclohydrolase II RibA [Halomonas sp. 18H]|uniref:GTP cyclohydrolase II RibA n=1 Tax=Halomonas almeriensis TaxID=308163 RepID=UPI002232CA80|nr:MULTISPECIES: GTP cyclohydrolase II RibA [Halomonas]MCW4153039.1 GTP cyclohydrolase II RibA [Halomonas sp. 18H]MDN3554270.1 GTP cyclohydrolase II RibA [Halomonas almeriensis]